MSVFVATASPTRARWAVAALFSVNGFLVGSWAPQIPLLLVRLGISEFTLGLLILGFGLGALFAMPTAGFIIGRQGSRVTVTWFAFAAAFGLILVIAAPNVGTAALALVLFGGLVGGMDVSMNANAVAVERALGRPIMSSSHGFWSLGGFAGGAAGGLVIESFGALAHAGLVTALALAAVALAVSQLGGDDRPEAHERQPLVLPRDSSLYLVGLIALFCMVPEGAVLDWAALYLQQERGASVANAGFAFAAFSAAMAAMRFLGDGVRNRFGAVKTLRVSAVVAATGMLGAGLAPEAWMVIAAFCVAGLGIANTVPIAFSAGGNHPGLPPGAGMSIVTTMGYSGILVAPSAIGFVGERLGFAPVFLGVAVLLILVAALAGYARAAD
ncbi:MAG: MFS transporter [Mesorhizobium sp.]|nr:MFS transporter [Mesorhizobium sp.]MCO5161889.1 MFS transporter [Mesorhizobium sp.]